MPSDLPIEASKITKSDVQKTGGVKNAITRTAYSRNIIILQLLSSKIKQKKKRIMQLKYSINKKKFINVYD